MNLIRDSRDKVWIELVAEAYELDEGVRKAQGGKDWNPQMRVKAEQGRERQGCCKYWPGWR